MTIDTRVFITASSIGSYWDSNPNRVYNQTWKDASIYGYGFMPDNFVWMNYHIYEPVSSSENTLGWPLVDSPSGYVAIDWATFANGAYNNKFLTGFANVGPPPLFTYFNTLMNKRNGPYQWPSWKQLRNTDHPIVRYQRNNCSVPFLEPPQKLSVVAGGELRTFRGLKGAKTSFYVEPYLVSNNSALIHGIGNPENDTVIELKNSYGNNISNFSNIELNNKLNFKRSSDDTQIYDVLRDAYKSQEGENAIAGQLKYLKYSEDIFPKNANTYLKEVRGREKYDVVYWREGRDERNRSVANSQGVRYSPSFGPTFSLTQSRWPLDARRNYSTALCTVGVIGAEGELQNNYTTFFRRSNEDDKNNAFGLAHIGAIYNRKTLEYDRATSPPYLNDLTQSRAISGDTEWTVLAESGKRPFDETYNDFAVDARSAGQGYSVVPEFRISDHMEQYIDKEEGNFLAEIPNMFSISGASIPDSSVDSFFKTYSNSDFMKYFEVIKKEHEDIAGIEQITMKCDAVLKLNAYDGFYPVNRTLQLATLFSQSYGDHVIEAGYTSSATSWPSVNTNHTKWRSFLTPFFAPGILYNSIKSGMAVDFPIYTEPPQVIEDFQAGISSSAAAGIGSGDETQWARVLKTNFSKRIPFEGLLEPENYISKEKIYDMEPEWSASLRLYPGLGNDYYKLTNQASQWGGQGTEKYKLAMHNFLAEVPNFFLENNNFTTFTSKEIPVGGITITPEQATHYYGMDVYVANGQCKNLTDWVNRASSPEFTSSYAISYDRLQEIKGIHTKMYERDSAFGPPWVLEDKQFLSGRAHHSPIGNGSSHTKGTQDIQPYHYGYEPFTPAYFNGFGIIRLYFFPFKGAGKYTLDEIQSNLTASYIRMPTDRTGSAGLFINDNLLRLQTLNVVDTNVLSSDFSRYAAASGSSVAGSSYNILFEPLYTFTSTIHSASINWQQLSSSINFAGKTKAKKITYETDLYGNYYPSFYEDDVNSGDIWTIQPKWETPILNFYDKTITVPANGTGSKGMWHQYGDYCEGSKGIWFGIGDLPNSTISSSLPYNKYYWSYKGTDAATNRNIMDNRTENLLQLKKENAQVDIIINDVAKIWNFATCSIKHQNTTWVFHSKYGYPEPSCDLWNNCFNMGVNNYTFASNLVKAINSAEPSQLITASISPVSNFDDIPTFFTGSDAWYGHTNHESVGGAYLTPFSQSIMPGPPVKITLKIVNGEMGYAYPNYWNNGAKGNEVVCVVTSGIAGVGQDSEARRAYAGIAARSTSSEGWLVGGMDYATNQRVFATTASFYGGVSRDYKVESLADLVGFEKTQKKMGRAAKDKKIREAVVAIPYIEDNNEKKYFSISRKQIDLALNVNKQKVEEKEKPGDSIIDMVQKMQKYVIPPRMDFITYKNMSPFIMYVFEFEHTLSQRDLYDIWQGVQPEIGRSFKKQTSVISHKVKKGEFFEGDMPENVRWMVFKVKQKAAWNYYAKTADSSDDERFKFSFNIGGKQTGREGVPLYNYNWPYDQFSLVELIKIGTEVEFRKKE